MTDWQKVKIERPASGTPKPIFVREVDTKTEPGYDSRIYIPEPKPRPFPLWIPAIALAPLVFSVLSSDPPASFFWGFVFGITAYAAWFSRR